jgi:hypothetical protein
MLREFFTNGIAWIVGSVMPPFVSTIFPRLRNWLINPPDPQKPYATASIAIISGSSIAMLVIGLFLLFVPIGITAERFGEKAMSTNNFDEGYYSALNPPSAARITEVSQYPYCALTTIKIAVNQESYCEIIKSSDGYWTITVGGSAQCKVTCFKVKGIE